jgi:hypothetical protein
VSSVHKNAVLALLSCVFLSACASQPRQPFPIKLSANPSALVAQEIAFARLAQETGQWTAYRKYAAPDATLFVPEPVDAWAWLKEQRDPAKAITWQPHMVYISCDGKTAVTRGAWQGEGGKQGMFVNVWQRYENKRGEGKWFFQMHDIKALAKPIKAPEFIGSEAASCKGKAGTSLTAPAEGEVYKKSLSYDQSLSWAYTYRPDKSRDFTVALWDGTKMTDMFSYAVGAPQ